MRFFAFKEHYEMNILMPMAGEGQRFKNEGYSTHKPAIPVYRIQTGEKLPMVVCAVLDLPGVNDDGSNVIFIDRKFHVSDGVEDVIRCHFPLAKFITLESLTDGQASTCLMAKEFINNNEELLIAGCDNGMIFSHEKFSKEKDSCDCLVFTYRNNESVLKNPNAYGWMVVDENNYITDVSVKKSISDTPTKDHAVVATFYFKTGESFVKAAEKMIKDNDRINNEFYVDQVIKHILELGYTAKVFEIERYIGWGTPYDYRTYMETFNYWKTFLVEDGKFHL